MAEKIITIGGIRGSGKTKLTGFLNMTFGAPSISPGNTAKMLFEQKELAEEDALAYQTKHLFPDELMFKIIEASPASKAPIFFLEEIPGNKGQATMIREKFPQAEFYLIEITPSKSALKKRRKKLLEKESPEVIDLQIKIYEEETKPVLEEFPFKEILRIQGAGKEELQIHKEISEWIEKMGILKKRKN